MPDERLGVLRAATVAGLAAITLGPALGAGRLSYHEAFVAQAAREMVASGDLLVPTIRGLPWLEKPPLAAWLAAAAGAASGGVDEAAARAPSALAGVLACLIVASAAARRFGRDVGLLAGLVQATTFWAVTRGRLAEADMVLACLVAAAIAVLDRLRDAAEGPPRGPLRWAFFTLVGVTAMSKGIGFGAALVAATAAPLMIWDRDRATLRALASPKGWALAVALGVAWPAAVLARHPSAWRLWTLHVTDRLAARPEHFAGGPWWAYAPGVLGQMLPWTPLALVGARASLRRAFGAEGRKGGDRLLWAWAVGPIALLSTATVKNPHYAIHALAPWSIWAALALVRLGDRIAARGRSPRRCAAATFAGLACVYSVASAWLLPRFDGRGLEPDFYATAGASIPADEPLALLYDDWDRLPYPTPFGPVPHDLAVRLFYFDRPADWHQGVDALAASPLGSQRGPFAVLGRARDVPGLERLGRVEEVARGPVLRARASRVDDRAFALYRVTPPTEAVARRDRPSSR